MGLNLDSDQRNGMAFLRTHLEPALSGAKSQAHDHVFTAAERKRRAFAATCDYIRENPVRANLVEKAADWPYTEALIPGYPKLDDLRRKPLGKILENLYPAARPELRRPQTPAPHHPSIFLVAVEVTRL
jgi:hypothetical protein